MNILAFDTGGTSVKYGLIDETGYVSRHGSFKTPDTLDVYYKGLMNVYDNYRQEVDDIDGIALSMPGAVDSDEGVIYGSSALDYIHGPNIKKELEEMTGLRVELENDANCAALAEVWKGEAEHTKDSCFVVCGTGIGGAVVKNRAIHKGIHLHGGEFGYMIMDMDCTTGKARTWSHAGSTVATVKAVADELGVDMRELDGKKIFDEADIDPVYKKHVDAFYSYLAMGVYNIQYAYDPEVIVIGGGISSRDDLVERVYEKLDVLMKSIPEAKIRPLIKKCHFVNDANLMGAVFHYLHKEEPYLMEKES